MNAVLRTHFAAMIVALRGMPERVAAMAHRRVSRVAVKLVRFEGLVAGAITCYM